MNAEFSFFHQQIKDWLEDQCQFHGIEGICQAAYRAINHPPDVATLWKAFLTSCLPDEAVAFSAANAHVLSNLVKKLKALGGYAIKRHFIEILEQSHIILCVNGDFESLLDQLIAFHSEIERWIDGTWHRRFCDNPMTSLEDFSNYVKIFDSWVSAKLVSNLGYPIPCSKRSYGAWLRYSEGKATASLDFGAWPRLLHATFDTELKGFIADRVLDFAFSGNSRASLDCQSATYCYYCPLTRDCVSYASRDNEKMYHIIEDDLRLGQRASIPYDSLIKYLAGNRYQSTPAQISLVESFPRIDDHLNGQRARPTDADERFFMFLKALREFQNRGLDTGETLIGESFTSSAEIKRFMKPKLENEPQESFYTLILDNKYRMIRLQHITKGTLNQSLVHPREVFAPSIQLRAAAVILIHNHPSGDPTPSSQDIEITKRLIEAGDIIGIKVLDHVIIGKHSDFSFVDEEILF